MTEIDIILPVYNEEAVLLSFHQELRSALQDLSDCYRFRAIYVVDRCTDRSFDVLKAIAAKDPDVTVLHLSRRTGHQMSLVAGIDKSHGDAAIMMDCDLQHPPSVIPLLLEQFEQGVDVVQTIREYPHEAGLFKRVTSSVFYMVQNALSPIEIENGASDFRLISRKVVQVFQQSVREHNQFLRGLFRWVGFRQSTVHFISSPRRAGMTKYRLGRLLSFSITGIVSFSKVPLRFATIMGFLISVLSAVYAFYILAVYILVGDFPAGYASLILAVLFIGGLQLIMIGIVGEYLGAIFDEVKRRPLYVIDEVAGRL